MSPLNCPIGKNTIEIMITEYFIEIPNTNIKEPVKGFAYDDFPSDKADDHEQSLKKDKIDYVRIEL